MREHRVTDLGVGTEARSHRSCRGGRDPGHRTQALSSFLWQLPLWLLVPFRVSGWEVFSRVCFVFFSFRLILLRGGAMAKHSDVGEFFPTWRVVFLWRESQVCNPDVCVSW